MLDSDYIYLLDRHRNLLPMISLEGDETKTDHRRGFGTYGKIMDTMNCLKRKNIIFGCSITMTTDNLEKEEAVKALLKN
ncbi:MAG: hypothetical protein JXO44_03160 [Clostridia bacterium]|nr:hypothetical protein [Clostridia bacterium]